MDKKEIAAIKDHSIPVKMTRKGTFYDKSVESYGSTKMPSRTFKNHIIDALCRQNAGRQDAGLVGIIPLFPEIQYDSHFLHRLHTS